MKRTALVMAGLAVFLGGRGGTAYAGSSHPNLIIDSIVPTPQAAQAGQECRVSVVVKNNGNDIANNFEVGVWKSRDDEPVDAAGADAVKSVSSLAPGERVTLEFPVTYSQGGTFAIWALADAGRVVVETDETDNTRSFLIQVAGPTSIPNVPVDQTPSEGSSSGWNCTFSGILLVFLLSLIGFRE